MRIRALWLLYLKMKQKLKSLVKNSGINNIYVANKNSEEQTVVSGENKGIADFIIYLKK